MCGVIGIVSATGSSVNQQLFDGLTLLQHRGQDATGIATLDANKLKLRKAKGMVREVYRTRHIRRLSGNVGIGHVRYPTAGCFTDDETQPLYVNSPYGIAIAHNGNLTNSYELAEDLYHTDKRHINTQSDSEVLLNLFANELSRHGEFHPTSESIFKAVEGVYQRARGAYATIGIVVGFGIFAFRDPHSLRPLIYGKRIVDGQTDWAVASESVALTAMGYTIERDLLPGEVLLIDKQGNTRSRICSAQTQYSPCIFEYVYFSRPDSIVDGISVYQSRVNMGKKLAKKIQRVWKNHNIDIIMPVPDTSRTSALAMANELNVPFREGFIKNRYIGRTFIMPGQEKREKSVRQKLNPVPEEFIGKNVLLVDDSIVRGTTSKEIISLAKDAGANKVFMASASPPVRYPYVYGIDMPTKEDLIAHKLNTVEKVCKHIGADKLIYQDLDDLIEAVIDCSPNPNMKFDTSCFNGIYATGDISTEYLNKLSKLRSELHKQKKSKMRSSITPIHNIR